MIYGSSDMECNGQNFLSFWNIFCPFIPPNNLKNQNLKNKKTPRDIILHMCTINDNHMIYGSSDIELEILSFYTCVPWMIIIWCMIPDIWSATDRIFLSFWTTFCLFIILMTQEIKILKNKKTPGEIIILHKCIINDNHMMYGSWYMKHDGQNFFVILHHFLLFYPP